MLRKFTFIYSLIALTNVSSLNELILKELIKLVDNKNDVGSICIPLETARNVTFKPPVK